MFLTANRRLPFSAARRLARDEWTPDENQRVYGAGRERRWGAGANYEAHVVLEGEGHSPTGMLVNLTSIKDTLGAHIDRRYDHKFLNVDTPPFDRVPPTPENLSRQLLLEAQEVCRDLDARPVACHLVESSSTGATAYPAMYSGFSAPPTMTSSLRSAAFRSSRQTRPSLKTATRRHGIAALASCRRRWPKSPKRPATWEPATC